MLGSRQDGRRHGARCEGEVARLRPTFGSDRSRKVVDQFRKALGRSGKSLLIVRTCQAVARKVDLERFFVSGGGSDVEEVWKTPGERLIALNRQKWDRAKSSVSVRRRGRSGRDRRFSAVADRGRIGRTRHRARSGSARSGRAAATALRCGWCEPAVVGRWCGGAVWMGARRRRCAVGGARRLWRNCKPWETT